MFTRRSVIAAAMPAALFPTVTHAFQHVEHPETKREGRVLSLAPSAADVILRTDDGNLTVFHLDTGEIKARAPAGDLTTNIDPASITWSRDSERLAFTLTSLQKNFGGIIGLNMGDDDVTPITGEETSTGGGEGSVIDYSPTYRERDLYFARAVSRGEPPFTAIMKIADGAEQPDQLGVVSETTAGAVQGPLWATYHGGVVYQRIDEVNTTFTVMGMTADGEQHPILDASGGPEEPVRLLGIGYDGRAYAVQSESGNETWIARISTPESPGERPVSTAMPEAATWTRTSDLFERKTISHPRLHDLDDGIAVVDLQEGLLLAHQRSTVRTIGRLENWERGDQTVRLHWQSWWLTVAAQDRYWDISTRRGP